MMHYFTRLPALPRASGTDPGPVRPSSWNTMVDYMQALEKRINVLVPSSSPDIGCRVTPGGVTYYLKRRTRGGGGSSGIRAPWEPEFFQEGTDPSITYKCRFNLGTVNEVAATNWNDDFTLPSDDSVKFVVLTITSASGKITGVTISLDASAPAEDTIAKDTPPVSFKILLGAIGRTTAQMIVTTNLSLLAAEIFRESKTAPAAGAEPFSRWWRWAIQ